MNMFNVCITQTNTFKGHLNYPLVTVSKSAIKHKLVNNSN
uniref:Uncharacterized protein n=1 Tax=Anguilla anguilla TaxID=7936 RepID=A0A0E9SIF3_ANGAN